MTTHKITHACKTEKQTLQNMLSMIHSEAINNKHKTIEYLFTMHLQWCQWNAQEYTHYKYMESTQQMYYKTLWQKHAHKKNNMTTVLWNNHNKQQKNTMTQHIIVWIKIK